MAERVRQRKKHANNNRGNSKEQVDRMRRMSMFGLRIETRDDFDEENYQDFKNIRRNIKDKSHSYRIGPAPVTDYQTKPKHYLVSSPGCLDSDLEEGNGSVSLLQDGKRKLPYPQGTTSTLTAPSHISKAGCRSLISYFAKLGRHEGDEFIDLEFVDSLLRAGADINFTDKHGQTCFHEISRDWHTDVAQFALTRGADVNKCDNYGRTPLHLAAAVNYPEMVFWLINNGAKVDPRTVGEEQTPIHYAAKYNAEDSLKVLLHMGANIEDRDYKQRTPLFVAAETGRSEACCFLLEQGAPAGVYDDGGTLALSLMVEKMPDIAKLALGQYVTVDKALRKKYYYLNYLETDTWKKLNQQSKEAKTTSTTTIPIITTETPTFTSHAQTPLETICEYNEVELIMHPVILRLIAIKWQLFGKYHTAFYTAINLLYTILWTALGITMPRNDVHKYYSPLTKTAWRIVLELISLFMTLYFIITGEEEAFVRCAYYFGAHCSSYHLFWDYYVVIIVLSCYAMQILEFKRSERRIRKHKEWKRREVKRDLLYCHARWPEEERYLNSEMTLINTSSKSYLKNGWNGFEMFTNLVMAMVIFTRVAAVASHSKVINEVHYKSFPMLLILLWLRFMRYCQCYQSLGPFITMLSHVVGDTLKFGFLFFEFFIPYVCAFWILFGGIPGTQFEHFNDVVYQVFLMTLVDEYKRDNIMNQDKIMAQVLVGTYLAIASVVCLNLYIALMSQTFTRIYQNAKATAFMQQAQHLLMIEKSLRKAKRNNVKKFMESECSPQVVYDNGPGGDDDEDDSTKITMYRLISVMNEIRDKVLVLVMDSANNTFTKETTSTHQLIAPPQAIMNNGVTNQENRFNHLEDITRNIEQKIENIETLLTDIRDSFTNQTIISKANLTIIDSKAEKEEKENQKEKERKAQEKKHVEEKQNSWDKKLDAVMNAISKSNHDNVPKQITSAPYDQLSVPYDPQYFHTLPGRRHQGYGDDRYFSDTDARVAMWRQRPEFRHRSDLHGKFNSYHDINVEQDRSSAPKGQFQRQDELRKMNSLPDNTYHSYANNEIRSQTLNRPHNQPSSYKDQISQRSEGWVPAAHTFDQRYSTNHEHPRSEPGYYQHEIIERQVSSPRTPRQDKYRQSKNVSLSEQSKNQYQRDDDYFDNDDSYDDPSTSTYDEPTSPRSRHQSQPSSRMSNRLPPSPRKSRRSSPSPREHRQSPNSHRASQRSPSPLEKRSLSRTSSKRHPRRHMSRRTSEDEANISDDYVIGFEKITREIKRDEHDNKHQSKQLSETDLEKVHQLLHKHGLDTGALNSLKETEDSTQADPRESPPHVEEDKGKNTLDNEMIEMSTEVNKEDDEEETKPLIVDDKNKRQQRGRRLRNLRKKSEEKPEEDKNEDTNV